MQLSEQIVVTLIFFISLSMSDNDCLSSHCLLSMNTMEMLLFRYGEAKVDTFNFMSFLIKDTSKEKKVVQLPEFIS